MVFKIILHRLNPFIWWFAEKHRHWDCHSSNVFAKDPNRVAFRSQPEEPRSCFELSMVNVLCFGCRTYWIYWWGFRMPNMTMADLGSQTRFFCFEFFQVSCWGCVWRFGSQKGNMFQAISMSDLPAALIISITTKHVLHSLQAEQI